MEKNESSHPTVQRPLHVHVAGLLLAAVVFFSVFEPTLTLRYGPFVAFLAMAMSNVWRYRFGRTEALLIGFLLWSWISQTWTSNPERFEVHMLSLLSCAAIFLAIRQALSAGASIHLLYLAFVAGCFVGLFRTSVYANRSELVRDVAGRIVQAGDLNINSVAYSVVFAIVLTVLLLHGYSSRSIGKLRVGAGHLVGAALIVVLALGAVQTQTRGALVSLVMIFLWLLLARFARPVRTLTVVCAVAAIALSAGWIDLLLELIDFGNRTMGGLSGRTELWSIARGLWSTHLFIGVGFGGVRALSTYGLPSHNMILEIGSSLGVLGLGFFFGFLVSALRDRLGGLPAPTRRFRLGLIIVAFVPIVLSATWEFLAVAWVCLALLSHPAQSTIPATKHEPEGNKLPREVSDRVEESPRGERIPLRV